MHFRYPPYGTSAENPGTHDLIRYPEDGPAFDGSQLQRNIAA